MAFAHDAVRVLQCFIQFGSHKQRQEVFEDLKGGSPILFNPDPQLLQMLVSLGYLRCALLSPADDVLPLCKSQYGRHVVKKFLMYG